MTNPTGNAPDAVSSVAPSSPRKPIIGLTGGIGSGKSAVARHFASVGCAVIDADALAREALADPAVVATLRQWWGDAVIDAAGQVDRKAVAAIVFGDAGELARLEGVIHPRVHAGRAELRAKYAQDPAVVAIVEDCPLLIESGLEGQCDAIVYVETSRETRLSRVAQTRGWTAAELDRREKQQLPLDTKAKRADYIVQNDGPPRETLTRVRQVLSEILQPPR